MPQPIPIVDDDRGIWERIILIQGEEEKDEKDHK